MIKTKRATFVLYLMIELGLLVFFWPQIRWVGGTLYIALDRHFADCALTGCPTRPFW